MWLRGVAEDVTIDRMLLRAMIDGRGHIDLSLVASALCPSR